MKIAIGSDHAGFEYKELIFNHLRDQQFDVFDYGTKTQERCDYPDYAHQVAAAVNNADFPFGVLICGSANGVAMAANKHSDIRAAICWTDEITKLARSHNNANIICLPARFITTEEALQFIDTFFSTSFEGGRHTQRVHKISKV